MRELPMLKIASVVAVTLITLGAALWGTPPAWAIPGQSVGSASMRLSPLEPAGCYRLGETGYHWYHWCVGPHVLYPHHRICHHGACYYR
jgi:hypothetical protein